MNAEEVLAALSLEEKASLAAGVDTWHMARIERLGIGGWRMTDGPAGARGTSFEDPAPSACLPCGSALGATWDRDLVAEVGAVIARQARAKGARVLLAPTVNLHRSPLGGRTFEAYSEDPVLSGLLGAAFVSGAQAEGVICTVKHLAGNEAEFERATIDSVIDERSLRELYLLPFELTVRRGGCLGVMTAYNRLNGVWCSQHRWLLADVLRGEWGFDGLVVTDWHAATDTVASVEAGVDVEMPGPPRRLGPASLEAVAAGRLDGPAIEQQARHILRAFQAIGALEDPPPGDDEGAPDRPEDRSVARRAATGATVLLRNDGVLPFDRLASLAVVGPNAARPQMTGGGSAALRAPYRVAFDEALRRRLKGTEVCFEPGCDTKATGPPLRLALDVSFSTGGREVLRRRASNARLAFVEPPVPGLPAGWRLVATGRFVPAEAGPHQLSLVQAGSARVFLDGEVVLDGVASPPPPGRGLFGIGSEPLDAVVDLEAGRPYDVRIELQSPASKGPAAAVVGARAVPPSDLLERAVAAARRSEAAVVVVGTDATVESEGYDRSTLELPGRQGELVAEVCAANPQTVVVVNAGAPVDLACAERAAAVVVVWFGGQEMAEALADVLSGRADPGGRLATTFPRRLEDTPAFGAFPGEHGEVRYGESVFVGYRWYEARGLPVRFPFGHGLSYTTFQFDEPVVEGDTVKVTVTNTGGRPGTEVVQLYVEPIDPPVTRPPKELKAFAKVFLDPGQSKEVELHLDDRSFAYWQPDLRAYEALCEQTGRPFAAAWGGVEGGWRVAPGPYRLHVGRSSADIAHVVEVER